MTGVQPKTQDLPEGTLPVQRQMEGRHRNLPWAPVKPNWLQVSLLQVRGRALSSYVLLRKNTGHPIAKGLLQPLIEVDQVLGSIYGGVTCITEAAAVSVAATLAGITIRSEMILFMLFEGQGEFHPNSGNMANFWQGSAACRMLHVVVWWRVAAGFPRESHLPLIALLIGDLPE